MNTYRVHLQTRFNCNTILLNYINLSFSSLFFFTSTTNAFWFFNKPSYSLNVPKFLFFPHTHKKNCMKCINVFLKHVGLNRLSQMRQVLRNLTLVATTRTQAISVPQLLPPLPHPIHNRPQLS